MIEQSDLDKSECLRWLVAHTAYSGEGCLTWPFATEYNGRGHLGFQGKIVRAHRLMCTLVKGPPPTPKHQAAHSCGNGHLACVHPLHLSWKTQAENEADKRLHGTAKGGASGEGGNRTHLSIDQIKSIRADKGLLPAAVTAKKHGVRRSTVRYWQDSTHDPAPPGKARRKSCLFAAA